MASVASDKADSATIDLEVSRSVDASLGTCAGTDSDDNKFASAEAMWKSATSKGLDAWYGWGVEYYKRQEATIDGVLGGLGDITHAPDVEHSRGLLQVWAEERLEALDSSKSPPSLPKPDAAGKPDRAGESQSATSPASAPASRFPLPKTRALDLGGGMGRVSAAVLAKVFSKIDLVESSDAMVKAAREHIPKESQGTLEVAQMQAYDIPSGVRYTCVWMQFAAGYLTDADFVGLLRKCSAALDEHPARCIVVKESVTSVEGQSFYLDREDHNVVRSREYFRALIGLAGLDVALEVDQKPWPAGLFPMTAFVCLPSGTV